MVQLGDAEFPSKFLNCYESVLINILKFMGLPEETPLMGTQAYFVFREDILSISPRFNRAEQEWERVHGLVVETLPIIEKAELRDEIVAKLDDGVPVCLPVDIYHMPHTPHYNRLHHYHYVNIFGYDDGRYYMVCPYYRHRGWVEADLVHSGFWAALDVREYVYIPAELWEMKTPREHNFIIFVPELKLDELSPARIRELVEQSCRYMLGLTVPDAVADFNPLYLGLAGIRTLSNLARQEVTAQTRSPLEYVLLNQSRQFRWMGFSRYWFHKLIQTCQETLLPADVAAELQGQFKTVIGSWEAIGARLGSDVHSGDAGMVQRAVSGLEQLHAQEQQLFISLLTALPDVQDKVEILERLETRRAEAGSTSQFNQVEPRPVRFVPPRTPTEELLAGVWTQVLDVEQVGVHDNFFDLGGDSLLMSRVHGKLREVLDQKVPMVELFKHPTISSLAKWLGQSQGGKAVREQTRERGRKYRAVLNRQKRRLRRPGR